MRSIIGRALVIGRNRKSGETFIGLSMQTCRTTPTPNIFCGAIEGPGSKHCTGLVGGLCEFATNSAYCR